MWGHELEEAIAGTCFNIRTKVGTSSRRVMRSHDLEEVIAATCFGAADGGVDSAGNSLRFVVVV